MAFRTSLLVLLTFFAAGCDGLTVGWFGDEEDVIACPAPVTPPDDPQDAPAAPHEDEDVWTVMQIDGQRVGYGHTTSKTVERDGETLVQTEDESQMLMKRFGQEIKQRTEIRTLAKPNGDLVEFWSVSKNPPAAPTRTHAVVQGNELVLTTETAGKSSERRLPWKPGTKSPHYDWNLKSKPLKDGEKRTVEVFLPELNAVAEMSLEKAGEQEITLLDGEKRTLERLVSTNSVMPGKISSFVDDEGDELVTCVEILGMKIESHVVPEETALEKLEGAELDLALETLVPVEPIANAHRTKRAVYRIRTPGEDPAKYVVDGGRQSVKRIDDETIEVTVRAAEFPAKPSDETTDAAYVAATQFLQSGDAKVVGHAEQATGELTDQVAIAKAMETYVREKISEKNFSTALASAAEVAERLEGDCTEHAVLLAAMLRAKKIPSRIVVGFVYAESQKAFAGHMWTEAFLGNEWVPLDATLGRAGTKAAHLKLADSAFADEDGHPITSFLPVLECIGKLEIEVVEVE